MTIKHKIELSVNEEVAVLRAKIKDVEFRIDNMNPYDNPEYMNSLAHQLSIYAETLARIHIMCARSAIEIEMDMIHDQEEVMS